MITKKKLESKVDYLNEITGRKFIVVHSSYGYTLSEEINDHRRDVENDAMSSSEMYAYLRGILAGLKLN